MPEIMVTATVTRHDDTVEIHLPGAISDVTMCLTPAQAMQLATRLIVIASEIENEMQLRAISEDRALRRLPL